MASSRGRFMADWLHAIVRPRFLMFWFRTEPCRYHRSWGWNTIKHAFGADILIDVRPMYAITVSNDSPICPLFGSCIRQSPRPGKRNADYPPIHELSRNRVIGDVYILNSDFLYLYRSVHTMPP